ncbi:uncharacterized protein LOC110443076 [Mizuhopecten yessoensis]|uniref:uncharacterized protein LOC110443076 n=1 Tax=Mizuhopecten yessoensis TaxID=6573 RepID=UPI000B457AE8|nr:uncharacterized protein LOC110443076 [Mizuhopecten yessoensis]
MLTEEEKRLIDEVYYNFKNGGSFMSPTKVHQVLKSQGFTSPGLYKIRRYIQSLDDYSLQKPVKRSFKRARVEVSGPYEEFQADLADVSNLSKQNGGTRFLLVVIDVFSRFLWVEPTKTKTTKDVLDAFRKIVRHAKKPKRLYTDAGKEFTGKLMRRYCEDNDIKYYTSRNEQKASVVERVIRTVTIKQNQNFRFKLDSLVRISHLKQLFKRAYQQQWSSEIFKVNKRFLRQGIPQYQLIDFLNEPITGNFYQSELQRVDKDENALWYIEEKVKKRKRAGQIEWLVKFEGWPSKYNQWIAEKDIRDVSKA